MVKKGKKKLCLHKEWLYLLNGKMKSPQQNRINNNTLSYTEIKPIYFTPQTIYALKRTKSQLC